MANAFLLNHGEPIHSYKDMNPDGDLIAAIDTNLPAFYAFVTRKIMPSRTRENITIFNQNLEEISSSTEGCISEIEFGLPDKYYFADVLTPEKLKKDSEHWVKGENGIYLKIVPRISIDSGLIYRITSKNLIQRIKGVYNTPELEIKSSSNK